MVDWWHLHTCMQLLECNSRVVDLKMPHNCRNISEHDGIWFSDFIKLAIFRCQAPFEIHRSPEVSAFPPVSMKHPQPGQEAIFLQHQVRIMEGVLDSIDYWKLLSIHPSFHPSIYLSIYLSRNKINIYIYTYMYIYVSIYVYVSTILIYIYIYQHTCYIYLTSCEYNFVYIYIYIYIYWFT